MTSPLIGIVTQARTGSTRLPNKVFRKINELPLLSYHIERLKWSNLPIFIATTQNSQDDAIAEYAKKSGIGCFRGSEDNVLSRFYECALHFKIEIIIRVTSDCPLIDGTVIRQGLDSFTKENNPFAYLSNVIERTFPRGADFEIFNRYALSTALKSNPDKEECEHVTPFIYRNKENIFSIMHWRRVNNDSDIRITVDTPDDFNLVERLVLDYQANKLSMEEIILLFKNNPELREINRHIEQKKLKI